MRNPDFIEVPEKVPAVGLEPNKTPLFTGLINCLVAFWLHKF